MAQMTFWCVTTSGSIGLTVYFYPGVARHAASKRDALIAAAMAGVLLAIPVGLGVGAVVNAVTLWR